MSASVRLSASNSSRASSRCSSLYCSGSSGFVIKNYGTDVSDTLRVFVRWGCRWFVRNAKVSRGRYVHMQVSICVSAGQSIFRNFGRFPRKRRDQGLRISRPAYEAWRGSVGSKRGLVTTRPRRAAAGMASATAAGGARFGGRRGRRTRREVRARRGSATRVGAYLTARTRRSRRLPGARVRCGRFPLTR